MVNIPFCPRCNTSLENYMQFCWNCGTKQVPGQTFGPQQPQQVAVVQQPVQTQQQGYYQQGYVVTQPTPQPYQQTVTVAYGTPQVGIVSTGPMQPRNQTIVPCPFCDGEGHHPMRFDEQCPICRGAGKLNVQEPFTTCQQCEGSGKKFATMDQICQSCQGRGVISL